MNALITEVITLLSIPEKVYAKVLNSRCTTVVEEKLTAYQCGFCTGRCTSDELLTLRLILESSCKFAQPVFACFANLEKAYDRVPREKLWEVLITYGIEGPLLGAMKSLYRGYRSCLKINYVKSENFTVAVGLRQECMLSPLHFIIYMDWMLQRSRGGKSFRYGNLEMGHLAYADDLVSQGSTQSDLQRALDRFSTVCAEAGMRISVGKSEVMVALRSPIQCLIRLDKRTLKQVKKFKYLGINFTSEGRANTVRIGQAGAVMRELWRSAVRKAELSRKAKL